MARSLIGRRKAIPGLPKRAKEAVELLVWGIPDGDAKPDRRAVAAHMGIGVDTVRQYLSLPAAENYQKSEIAALRAGEQARSIRTAINIRDSSATREEAAHRKVALDAAKYIEGRDAPGIVINNNLAVGMTIVPGYQINNVPTRRGVFS